MFQFEGELEKSTSEEVQIYAEKEYASQIITSMLSKDNSSHSSITVDSMSLFESNIAFAHYMFQNPRRALKLLDDAFRKVSLKIMANHVLRADMIYKENLHVRLIALPNLPEVYRSNLPNCSDVGQFLCISGTVVKASTSKMLQYKKFWRCGKCKHEFIVEAQVEQGYVCEKPSVCQNPEFCNGKVFTLMSTDINAEWCKDYQEIKLQEQVYNLNVGTVPRSMWVVLEDDLVEACYPGNDVIVSGVLIQQWKPLFKGSTISIELVILAHNIEVQNKMTSGVVSKELAQEFKNFWLGYNSDPLSGRNFILASICPQVFGLYIVKLSVALVLAGGVQKKCGNSRIRGDSHLLLIGDPGTAKSQFLKFATKVSSRAVLTSGIGTTNAGLTVSAVKESGRWELEAGALVLADGGICCIDEFSCIKEQDKTCIHEAMEQQTISVAKAGLVCSLNTRCSILAATNPKGKYDESMSISENTALGSPLLSRFDIILVLLDTYDENWDDMVASYILCGRNIAAEKKTSLWSVAKIKSYFILIRHIHPKMTPNAERVLQSYYTKQRSLQSRNASRTTPRLLQSLIRLAEGHARLMFRTEVLVIDAVIAIILIESSMLSNSILEGLRPLHTVFPENPSDEYIDKAGKIFQNLNIHIPFEENFDRFYEESVLKNLLSDISAVWSSKDVPYIFGSPPCDISANSEHYQESDHSVSEITANEFSLDGAEDSFHKLSKRPRYFENTSHVQQFVVVEVHKGDSSSSQTIPKELNNQVSALSDLKNVFSVDITSTETQQSKIFKNSSILDQILAEPDNDGDVNIVPSQSNKLSPANIFNNFTDRETMPSEKKTLSTNKKIPSEAAKSKFERSTTDLLEELGISPEKEQENSQVYPTISSNEHSNLASQSSSINKIFPMKKSLADQLKMFVYSKSNLNCQQTFVTDKIASSTDENNHGAETSSVSARKSEDKLQKNICSGSSKTMNLPKTKKSAFKMIIDRYKSSQSNELENINKVTDKPDILENNMHDKRQSDTSENIYKANINSEKRQNDQSLEDFKNNSVSRAMTEDVNTVTENINGESHLLTDIRSSNNSLTTEEHRPSFIKNTVPEKLKMFAFSKRKSSKSQSSVNSRDKE